MQENADVAAEKKELYNQLVAGILKTSEGLLTESDAWIMADELIKVVELAAWQPKTQSVQDVQRLAAGLRERGFQVHDGDGIFDPVSAALSAITELQAQHADVTEEDIAALKVATEVTSQRRLRLSEAVIISKEDYDKLMCPECGGRGWYYTEWSDAAESDPTLRSAVLHYPNPPDGTVCIRCHVCSGNVKVPHG